MKDSLILATGFGAFPGAPENPTAWAMTELQNSGWQPVGARLVVQVLPVTFDLWDTVMAPLLGEHSPDAVIAFGLSAKATGVTLESTARNCVAMDRPDFAGGSASTSHVNAFGAQVHPTRLPLKEIIHTLREADIPISRSDDAGNYLCNLLFYRLMEAGPAIAGFIHVPYLDSQVVRLRSAGHTITAVSTLTEEQLLRATKAVIQTCALSLIAGQTARQGT